jgi:tetratricopeptide (TPR) repeat protein
MSAATHRWLFGPVPDLLLGCGVGYGLVFLLLLLDPSRVMAWVPAAAAPLVILVSGTPHYGATLLRVYERAEDRRAYALFAIWATFALAGLFLAGLASVRVASLLLTVYLSWSPWHYAGQNYGVALMFLGRRGVTVTPRAKRLYYASFFLSFVLTFLAQHGAVGGPGYAPFAEGGGGIRFLPIGIPAALASGGLLLAGVAYGVALVLAFGSFLRSASLRDAAPAAILTATHALWFVVPVFVRHWDVLPTAAPFAAQFATYAFLWVAAAHSLQYLWVTTFYTARTEGIPGRARYLGKSLLAGAALWNIPLLLFGRAGLGWSQSPASLSILVASVANIHHFVLDGAIWKLRDGRVARILIRARQAQGSREPGEEAVTKPVGWLRNLVWAAGVVGVAMVLLRTYEREIGFVGALQAGNLERAQQATERLARIGLDEPAAHVVLGRLHEDAHAFEAAERAYAAALALAPDDVEALNRRGVALLGLGRNEEARQVLERAVALAPNEKLIEMNLARARARTQRGPP